MTKRLLVLADLGRMKAYRLEEGEQFSKPRLRLLEEWETNITHHLSEDVTDQAGRFRKGSVPAGPSNLSDGEEHNLGLERRKRALKTLAEHISELAGREDFAGLYFAAGREINQALVEALDPITRSRMEKNVILNLTKVSPEVLVEHFSE